MAIYMWRDIVPNQGPCTEGFHVPLNTERTNLYNKFIALGFTSSSGTNFSKYLKLPMYGKRSGTDASRGYTSKGYYWSANALTNQNYAYCLEFQSDAIVDTATSYSERASGCQVRGFKDTSETPDSNWTVLYQGTGNAGIYHNSTLGIISISSDGTNWITIADKNLGATTVYNYGDTKTINNCGGYFQRGNNYVFPNTTSITTSSTQVDASLYGPGNYYSGDKFIIRTSSPLDWSSVKNNNLRGGEDA